MQSNPTPLHPHGPSPIPQLRQLTQPPDENPIEPQQRQIEQIATPALESESRAPSLQQIEALPGVIDRTGRDEEVQEERRGEGEICAGICCESQ